MNILLGLTGSVASTLGAKLAANLSEVGNVRVVMTESATHFIDIDRMLNDFEVFTDQDEWHWEHKDHTMWEKNDPILHVELRKWASALVIAPLSVNTLGKMANGLCDNLVTSIYRAWDMTRPVIVAPAANTFMWQHPITEQHLKTLASFHGRFNNFFLVPPIAKKLACGDEGEGAMATIDSIVEQTKQSLQWTFPLKNCSGIPVNNHPGAFLTARNSKRVPGELIRHTGVDLYTVEGEPICAMEAGRVVNVEPFTGSQINSPWWLDTSAVLVEGASGVVCYGEVQPKIEVGCIVQRGDVIAEAARVLPVGKERSDIPGHSPCMLHIELYNHGTKQCSRGWRQKAWCYNLK